MRYVLLCLLPFWVNVSTAAAADAATKALPNQDLILLIDQHLIQSTRVGESLREAHRLLLDRLDEHGTARVQFYDGGPRNQRREPGQKAGAPLAIEALDAAISQALATWENNPQENTQRGLILIAALPKQRSRPVRQKAINALLNGSIKTLKERKIPLYTVGFGRRVDQRLLTKLSMRAAQKPKQGRMRSKKVVSHRALPKALYTMMRQQTQRTRKPQDVKLRKKRMIRMIRIPEGTEYVELDVVRQHPDMVFNLFAPSGQHHGPNSSDNHYTLYGIANPEAGKWHLEIQGSKRQKVTIYRHYGERPSQASLELLESDAESLAEGNEKPVENSDIDPTLPVFVFERLAKEQTPEAPIYIEARAVGQRLPKPEALELTVTKPDESTANLRIPRIGKYLYAGTFSDSTELGRYHFKLQAPTRHQVRHANMHIDVTEPEVLDPPEDLHDTGSPDLLLWGGVAGSIVLVGVGVGLFILRRRRKNDDVEEHVEEAKDAA